MTESTDQETVVPQKELLVDFDDRDLSIVEPVNGSNDKAELDISDADRVQEPVLDQNSLQIIGSDIAQVKDMLVTQFKSDSHTKLAFDKLHREMTDYKENFLQRAQEPLYRGLISVLDGIAEMKEQDKPVTLDDLEWLASQIEEILNRQGVEKFVCPEDYYDPKQQKAITTEVTSEPEDHRRISRRIRVGYSLENRIIRAEGVSILVLKQTSGESQ